MSMRGFADHLGVALRTVAKWEQRADQIEPRPPIQEALDAALRLAPDDAQQRFHDAIRPEMDTAARANARSTEVGPHTKVDATDHAASTPWPLASHERSTDDNQDFALLIDHAGHLRADTRQQSVRLGNPSLAAMSRSVLTNTDVSTPEADPLFVDTAHTVWPDRWTSDAGPSMELRFPPTGLYDGARLRIERLGKRSDIGRTTQADMYLSTDQAAAQVRLIDARQVLRQRADLNHIPSAYRLDAFTAGIVQAVVNLDQSLLGDDAVIARAQQRLDRYGRTIASEIGRDAADELGAAAQAWIGSRFCAGHICRHVQEISGHPTFWTCEQRGDEASTWLFFDHKYRYLRRTVDMFGSNLTRTFCIPEDVLSASAADRVLLFLVFALMEASGNRVILCADPAYADVEGFVLSRHKVVVANWIRAEGLWHVDVTRRKPIVSTFKSALHDARADNLVDREDPYQRLAELADYLRLDWTWLVQRSRELVEHGCANLISPRSRLLSLHGLQQALRYVSATTT